MNWESPLPIKAKLYGYWRSSASWRLRWALLHKGIEFESIPVNLLQGEHKSKEHLKRNPHGTVPVLEVAEGECLSQSMAIFEWVEEYYQLKGPSLFPGTALERFRIREVCELINCEIAPLQTPACQKVHSDDPEKKLQWAQHFIRQGFTTLSRMLQNLDTPFCAYDSITAADMFVIPQIYNAKRYKIDVADEFPRLEELYQKALEDPAAQKAHPDQQLDAPKD